MITLAAPPAVLHGRKREIEVLGALVGQARAGCGGALTVVGAPGLGKSALLAAASTDGFRVLDTRGVRHERDVPHAGLHRLLRPLVELISRLPSAQAQVLAPIAGGGAAAGTTPFALYTAVCALLTEAAADGPVLCRADDAHRMDRVSLEALAFTARRISDVPVAMVFAAGVPYPDAPPPSCLADLPRIALEALDDEAGLRMLEELTGRDLGGDLAVELTELAGGCPLALAELAGTLSPDQLTGMAPPPRSLPAHGSLRFRYRSRYMRLAPGARRLVLMAAADDRVPLDVLTRAAVADGIDPHELETAESRGLIRIDGDTVTAADPLVRSTVYADASVAGRRAVHALLAEAFDQEGDACRRNWHRAALAGGLDDPLADDLAQAAAAAGAAGRYGEAARSWQRAAALATSPDVRADRLLTAASCAWTAGRTLRARALLRQVGTRGRADLLRGEIELADGLPVIAVWMLLEAADRVAATDPALALTALTRAGDGADAMGDVHCRTAIAERAIALGPRPVPAEELLAAHAVGMAASMRGDYAAAAGPLSRVLELAPTVDDGAAKTAASIAALTLGDDHRARELAAQAVAAARGQGDTVLEPRALTLLAHCEVALGRYPAAMAAAQDGLRQARATGQRNRATEQHAMIGLLAGFHGDAGTALAHLDGLAEEAGRRGLTRAAALGSWALACLDLAADRAADAAARLRMPAGAVPVHPVMRMLAMPHYVEAAVRAGRHASAVRAHLAFERWADGTRSPARHALAARCRALLADGDEPSAAHFETAIRLHRAGDSAFELARTELLYGHRLRRGRRPRDAREHLRNALHVFTDCGADRWAEQARAELRAAGDTLQAPDTGAFGALTAQQQQIARLVAAGATNREIAARLVISPRTVDGHLRNVFARLGIRSRIELARLQH